MQLRLLIVAASLAFSSSTPAAFGETGASDYERFRLFSDCKPMGLVVENLQPNVVEFGLSKDSVQAAVESRLRLARLYDSESWNRLYVNINTIGVAYSINVQYDKGLYDAQSDVWGYATTWNDGSVGTHRKNAGYILSNLSEIIDRFLVEFLRVNEEAC